MQQVIKWHDRIEVCMKYKAKRLAAEVSMPSSSVTSFKSLDHNLARRHQTPAVMNPTET